MDFLKRSLAPITDAAWDEIDEGATQVLKTLLTARKVVDIEGPHGMDFSAVNLGKLDIPKQQSKKDVSFGIRTVQPLIETRIPFELDIWEMDNLVRGAQDADLDPLMAAAEKIARFEDKAIYYGFAKGNIKGIKESSSHKALDFHGEPEQLLNTVSMAVTELRRASIEGPYSLVVGSEMWRYIASCIRGYPLQNQLSAVIDGQTILSPFLNDDDAFLISRRGGDLRMVLGQDLAIGYQSHTEQKVVLYFTESFTFQVIEPLAAIGISWNK
jgi:uncharacterized linocin/CFP29 family protein